MRKGQTDFIMFVSEILFFVLLLIIAIVLLSLQKGKLDPQRPQLGDDLIQQKADVLLINILRHQATAGFEGGNKASIADLIILDADGKYDAALQDALVHAMPDKYFELTIQYPGAKLVVRNTKYDGNYKNMLLTQGSVAVAQDLSNKATTPEWLAQNVPQYASTILLPGTGGNINIQLALSDKVGEGKLEAVRS